MNPRESSGIALTLWNVLAAGHIRSDEEEERRRQTGEKGRLTSGPWERTPDEKKMCGALQVVAKQVGTHHITAGKYIRGRLLYKCANANPA
jgi:hypothetical protein